MAMTIHTNIVSAEEEIFSGLAEMVVATGTLGDLGITYGHAPLLTALVPGPLRLRKQGGEEIVFYVSGGYLEVQSGEVNILADTALRGSDLDEAAASQAQKDAAAALQNMSGEMDFGKAASQLAAAAAQLRTLQQLRKKMGH
jgi:F-type H+-transporting ATPase subunit epsilon